MATINVYLSFDGNCEEAFNFYKSVFGKEFTYIGRYKDMPTDEVPIPAGHENKVMHVGLPISKETVLMGCDVCEEMSEQKFVRGNNFSISVGVESEEEGRRIFRALSAGGDVIMPLEKTFWATLFGMVNDKFGVSWMIDYSECQYPENCENPDCCQKSGC